jgi:hypothetical protein
MVLKAVAAAGTTPSATELKWTVTERIPALPWLELKQRQALS